VVISQNFLSPGEESVFQWTGSAWSASEVIMGGTWLETRMLVPTEEGWLFREAWQPVEGVCESPAFRCESRERVYSKAEASRDGGFATMYLSMPDCDYLSFTWFVPPMPADGGSRRRRRP
jgi:hypothetical protein